MASADIVNVIKELSPTLPTAGPAAGAPRAVIKSYSSKPVTLYNYNTEVASAAANNTPARKPTKTELIVPLSNDIVYMLLNNSLEIDNAITAANTAATNFVSNPAANAAINALNKATDISNAANAVLSTLAPFANSQGLLNNLFNEIITNNQFIKHRGIDIYNVPYYDEFEARLASHITVTNAGTQNINAAVKSNVYTDLSASKIKLYMDTAYAQLDPGLTKPDADAWNARVDQIRDALAHATREGQKSEIDDEHLVLSPTKTFMVPGNLKVQVRGLKPVVVGPPYLKPYVPQVQVSLKQSGGNNNPHAPLYPRITMNGGAHPLAVLEGGTTWNATIEVPKTDAMIDRLKVLSKQAVKDAAGNPNTTTAAGTIYNDIETYKTAIKTAAQNLQKDVQELNNLNTGLAHLNPGVGIDPSTMSQTELKQLAKKGEEINKKAADLSRRVTKLDEIDYLLQKLVKNQLPFGSV